MVLIVPFLLLALLLVRAPSPVVGPLLLRVVHLRIGGRGKRGCNGWSVEVEVGGDHYMETIVLKEACRIGLLAGKPYPSGQLE